MVATDLTVLWLLDKIVEHSWTTAAAVAVTFGMVFWLVAMKKPRRPRARSVHPRSHQ
jgi:hypothetical protein